jgi:uncharacterized protein YndB with AHSA1/START domain
MTQATTATAKSDRELVVTRTFDAEPAIVFKAWTTPDLMRQWWIPKSNPMTLNSIEMDARTGGGYRLEFAHPAGGVMAFFGKYLEVDPPSRLVWSNDESPDGAVTTVTFEPRGSQTFVTLHELYPSKEARDEALSGAAEGLPEQFAQLDALLAESAV